MNAPSVTPMSTAHNAKVTFLVSVDEIDGGYSTSALEYGIHTQSESLDELRHNIREAVECHFDPRQALPRMQYAFGTPI